MINYENKKYLGYVFFAISLVFLVFTSYLAFSKPYVWTDETFTLNIVKLPLNELLNLTSIDVHPPLYYLIYKFFIKIMNFVNFKDIIAIGRFVSLLPVYLLFALSLTKIRKNFGWLTAGIFTLTLISMPQLMNFFIELRMYGWGLFFVTTSFILINDMMIEKESDNIKWILLTLLTLASLYTHYYVAIASALIYLCLLVYLIKNNKDEIKKWLISVIVIVIGYIPWIPVIFQQISRKIGYYWIEPITFNKIVEYFLFIFSPDCPFIYENEPVTFSIFGLLLLISTIVLILKNKMDFKTKYALLGIGLCFAIPIVGIIISLLLRPFYHPRYILPVLGVFWLGISILLSKNFDKKYIFIPIIVIILISSVVGAMTFYDNLEYRQEVDTNITKCLNQQIGNGNIIICCQNNLQRHFSNYFLENNTYLISEFRSNDSYNDFLNNMNVILNDLEIKQQIQSGKNVFIVNLANNNNNIPSKLNNYSVVEVPIDIMDSKLFNYTDLKIYKIDLNNN